MQPQRVVDRLREAVQRIADSALSEVIVTNSMPLPSPLPDKIKVVSIAPIVASTIQAVFQDESVSEIFQGYGEGGHGRKALRRIFCQSLLEHVVDPIGQIRT